MSYQECTKNFNHCTVCGRKIGQEELDQNANDGSSNCCNEIIATYPIAEFMGECVHDEFDGQQADDEMGRGINMESEGRRPANPRSLF